MLQTYTNLHLKCESAGAKGSTWKMRLLLLKPSGQTRKQAQPAARRVGAKTQRSHRESSHWLPLRLQVTCRWSRLISTRSGDKAGKSFFSISWYSSICCFSLLQFLSFCALDSVWHFPEIIPGILSIVTVKKDLISSIIYMFPSFCPLYPHFKGMLIGLPVKKSYIAASVLR